MAILIIRFPVENDKLCNWFHPLKSSSLFQDVWSQIILLYGNVRFLFILVGFKLFHSVHDNVLLTVFKAWWGLSLSAYISLLARRTHSVGYYRYPWEDKMQTRSPIWRFVRCTAQKFRILWDRALQFWKGLMATEDIFSPILMLTRYKFHSVTWYKLAGTYLLLYIFC